MKKFFEPKSACLIGATDTPLRPGASLSQNLEISFGDRFFPVNPKRDEIFGRRCFHDVNELPETPDVAVVFIPGSAVPAAVEACAKKGVKRVIVESGGFAETGAEGAALERRCVEIGRAAGMRLWGPNCMGLINVHEKKVLSFLMTMMWKDRFQAGGVSLVVQSGMLSAGFLLHILSRTPFGLSKIASIGNKMDVDEVDVLDYLVNDPQTGVIAMYLESFSRGRDFYELVKSADKPVVALKGGRTAPGMKAAASHTAALAQDDAVADSALRQAGAIRVYGMTELMDVARCLGVSEAGRPARGQVAVLTFSGGAGVVTSDDLADHGLTVAPLSEASVRRLQNVFPAWMAPENPVDLYPAIEKNGPKAAMIQSLEAVMEDENVDAVYAHLFAPPVNVPLFDYDHMETLIKKHKKPMVVWIMGHADGYGAMSSELARRGIPVVDELARGVRVLAALTVGR